MLPAQTCLNLDWKGLDLDKKTSRVSLGLSLSDFTDELWIGPSFPNDGQKMWKLADKPEHRHSNVRGSEREISERN